VDANLDELTKRQQEIAECVAEGMSNKEIGRYLGISAATVKTHLHNIFERVGGSRIRLAMRCKVPLKPHRREKLMEPYQQRVVQELAELDARMKKLQKFFETDTFAHVDSSERFILGNQYGHMVGYRQCLRMRLQHWRIDSHEQDTGVQSQGQGEENHQGSLQLPGL
jgi:DNA-binding CsgD family transcriptional regulator